MIMMAETEAQTMEIVVVTSDDDYNDDNNNNNMDGDCGNDNNISNSNNSEGEGCPSSLFLSSPSPIRLKTHISTIAAAAATTTNNNYKAKNICASLYLFLHVLLIACLIATQIFGVYVLFVEGLSTDLSIVLLLTHLVLLPLIPLGLAFIVAPLKSRRAELVAARIVLFLYWALFAASLVVMFFWAYKDGENEEVSFELMLSQFLFGTIDFASGILFTIGWAYGDYYS